MIEKIWEKKISRLFKPTEYYKKEDLRLFIRNKIILFLQRVKIFSNLQIIYILENKGNGFFK